MGFYEKNTEHFVEELRTLSENGVLRMCEKRVFRMGEHGVPSGYRRAPSAYMRYLGHKTKTEFLREKIEHMRGERESAIGIERE